MSEQTLPAAAERRHRTGPLIARALTIATVITAVALTPTLSRNWDGYVAFITSHPPHAPQWWRIAEASLAIRIHLAAVLTAAAIGAILLSGVKGNLLHRVLGWTWSVFMVTAAASSLFIGTLNGGISFLHAFALITLVSVPAAVWSARSHKVNRHANIMTSVFVGGIGIAGLFAFLPGRLMYQVLFG